MWVLSDINDSIYRYVDKNGKYVGHKIEWNKNNTYKVYYDKFAEYIAIATSNGFIPLPASYEYVSAIYGDGFLMATKAIGNDGQRRVYGPFYSSTELIRFIVEYNLDNKEYVENLNLE